MRKIDLDRAVEIPTLPTLYSLAAMLRQFVFTQDWSADEASVAAFERITAAVIAHEKAPEAPALLDERDFQTLIARVKQIQFPAQFSIELGHLRNHLVLKSPKVEAAP